jgi:hypothetical protein
LLEPKFACPMTNVVFEFAVVCCVVLLLHALHEIVGRLTV